MCDFAEENRNKKNHQEIVSDGGNIRASRESSGAVIQLFEWPFSSVVQECQRLGEECWEDVKLSPVNAHLVLSPDIMEGFDVGESSLSLLYPYWHRYQTALYEIKSRSGTEADLRVTTE